MLKEPEQWTGASLFGGTYIQYNITIFLYYSAEQTENDVPNGNDILDFFFKPKAHFHYFV